nr:hypothetical protein [Tanacetum cinerariifolium]
YLFHTFTKPSGLLVLLVVAFREVGLVHVHHVLVSLVVRIVEGQRHQVVVGEYHAGAAAGVRVDEVHLLLRHQLESFRNQHFYALAQHALLNQLNLGGRTGGHQQAR